jgi:hypothetical protein
VSIPNPLHLPYIRGPFLTPRLGGAERLEDAHISLLAENACDASGLTLLVVLQSHGRTPSFFICRQPPSRRLLIIGCNTDRLMQYRQAHATCINQNSRTGPVCTLAPVTGEARSCRNQHHLPLISCQVRRAPDPKALFTNFPLSGSISRSSKILRRRASIEAMGHPHQSQFAIQDSVSTVYKGLRTLATDCQCVPLSLLLCFFFSFSLPLT